MGAILAGGAARRLGGGKAALVVAGRPLASYAADALLAVADVVAIVGKRGEEVPDLRGVEIWDGEPSEPRHPAAGIAYALERAGEAVLVCAGDMPFVGPPDCRALIAAAEGGSAVATAGGGLEPLLGVYPPEALEMLRRGARDGTPMRALAADLDAALVPLPERALRSVNTPEELAAAERELGQPRSST